MEDKKGIHNMTVKELIKALEKLPSDAKVTIHGNEFFMVWASEKGVDIVSEEEKEEIDPVEYDDFFNNLMSQWEDEEGGWSEHLDAMKINGVQ